MTTTVAATAKRSAVWKVALVAFLAMCANDIAGTVMVVFGGSLQRHFSPATLLDVIGWSLLAHLRCPRHRIHHHRGLANSTVPHDYRRRLRCQLLIGTIAGVAIASSITHH